MSQEEWADYSKKIEDIRKKCNQAKLLEQQQAREHALKIWNSAKPASSNHPYLKRKQISAFIARQRRDLLIVPIVDFDHQIWSLQFISNDGSKKLLTGGAKKNHFIPINKILPPSRLLICEGFATGATLAQEYPFASVIAAIDSGNLEAVATTARSRWKHIEISLLIVNKVVVFTGLVTRLLERVLLLRFLQLSGVLLILFDLGAQLQMD